MISKIKLSKLSHITTNSYTTHYYLGEGILPPYKQCWEIINNPIRQCDCDLYVGYYKIDKLGIFMPDKVHEVFARPLSEEEKVILIKELKKENIEYEE